MTILKPNIDQVLKKGLTLQLGIILMLFSLTTSGQRYAFEQFGIEDGLPSTELMDLVQTRDGVLWIATVGSLVQYDGQSFSTFSQNDSLCSTRIISLMEDSKGRLWCGGYDNGFSVIERGQIVDLPIDSGMTPNEMGKVKGFVEDRLGHIWMFSYENIFIYKDNRIFNLTEKLGIKIYHPTHGISTRDGNIWVNHAMGVLRFDPEDYSYKNFETRTLHESKMLFEDQEGTIWCASDYMHRLDGEKMEQVPGFYTDYKYTVIAENAGDRLWFGGSYGRLTTYDLASGRIRNLSQENGLPVSDIKDILVDREGNAWIATDGDGLLKFRSYLFTYFDEREDLPSKKVTGFVVNADSSVWCSSFKGMFRIKNDEVVEVVQEEHLGVIWGITGDPYGNIWMATQFGVVRYSDGKLHKIVHQPNPDNVFYCVYHDPLSDKVYFGGEKSLVEYDIQSETYVFYVLDRHIGEDDLHYGIHDITRVNDSLLALVTFLEQPLLFSEGRFYEFDALESQRLFLAALDIGENKALFGNKGNLFRYDHKKAELSSYSGADFPEFDGFNSFLRDGDQLWIGSNNAISRFDMKAIEKGQDTEYETWNVKDGFINGEVFEDAMARDRSGAIWLGTSMGIVKFDPTEIRRNQVEPTISINNIELFAQPVEWKGVSDSIHQGIGWHPEFSHDKNHITFNIQAVSLSDPHKIRYRYKLEGFDKDWSAPTFSSRTVYSYLPPGNYTFLAMAENGSGVWNSEPVKYALVINAPWWQKWWFIAISGLLVQVIFILIYYSRVAKERQKMRKQEELTQQLINAQEQERRRISGELHDGVGQSLVSIRNMLVKNNGHLPREAIDSTIEEVRSISRNLHPFQLERLGLTKAIRAIVDQTEKVTDIFFSHEIETIDGLFPPEMEINLYRIVQECLNNIARHSGAEAAKVSVQKHPDQLVMTVQDNGKGFDASRLQGTTVSLGLTTLQERIKFLKGYLSFESAPNKGSKFIFTIPLK